MQTFIFHFSSCKESGIFPTEWKRQIWYLFINKRKNKMLKKINLFHSFKFSEIHLKVFKSLLYNEVYSFFMEKKINPLIDNVPQWSYTL